MELPWTVTDNFSWSVSLTRIWLGNGWIIIGAPSGWSCCCCSWSTGSSIADAGRYLPCGKNDTRERHRMSKQTNSLVVIMVAVVALHCRDIVDEVGLFLRWVPPYNSCNGLIELNAPALSQIDVIQLKWISKINEGIIISKNLIINNIKWNDNVMSEFKKKGIRGVWNWDSNHNHNLIVNN